MKNYLSIGQAAEYLGVSEQTLRRWDTEGTFKAGFISPGGHRFYLLSDLAQRTKGLYQIAKDWISAEAGIEPMETFYCPSIEIFKTRLERMARELEAKESFRSIGPIISSVAGEIGNNSFDHNIGNWPDVPGVFFAYDFGKRVIVLADRGRGVLATLLAVRPSLTSDKDALFVAFTESVTGRAPEHRGNGLKFVRKAVMRAKMRLLFRSGDSEVELKDGRDVIEPRKSSDKVSGSLTLLEF